jgi:hypothetical protein
VGATPSSAPAGIRAASFSSQSFRSSQRPPLVALPKSKAVALDFGAFIVPVGAAAPGVGGLGISDASGYVTVDGLVGADGLVGEADILSLLGLPNFQREGRARATRRPGGGDGKVEVLGQQLAIPDLGDGGALTFGQLPLVALALVLLSSLLLVGAVLPPGVVARTPISVNTFARLRQPLALAAIVILLPVAFVTLLAALS